MPESRISTKGQVVIPKRIRTILGLHEGDRVEFSVHQGHAHMTKKDRDALDSFLAGPRARWRRGELEALLRERHR